MCAIAGLINCGKPGLLQQMLDVMAHRGPGSESARGFSLHGSGLGHRRLAILDLVPTGNHVAGRGHGVVRGLPRP